jgi:hypothetical protein
MALTVINNNGCLTVTLDGTNSFDWAAATITAGTGNGTAVATYWPNGLQVTKITGKGSAGADIPIRDGTTTGQFVPPGMGTVTGDKACLYMTDGRWYKPCIVHADCTTDTGYQVGFYYKN